MKKEFFVVLSVVMMLLAGCAGSGSVSEEVATLAPVSSEYVGMTNPLGVDAAESGVKIFKTNCATCHGEQGHGDGPAGATLDPAPKNLAELQVIATDDYLFWRISTGKPGTSMVGWKGILSDEEIWQIVSFIRTLK